MNFTREMIEEFTKCVDDIEYFAENYIKINSAEFGLIPLVLNDFQRQAIKDYKEKNIFAKICSRIEGKTTIAAVILLHQTIFYTHRVSAVMAPTLMLSNLILDLIFEMYENLPDYFKYNLRITTRNKTKLEFENMCAIYSVGSNNLALRGIGISNLYIDEYESISILDKIFTSIIPCMSVANKSRLFAFTSTRTSDFFREYT